MIVGWAAVSVEKSSYTAFWLSAFGLLDSVATIAIDLLIQLAPRG
jgi:hypothetical protein